MEWIEGNEVLTIIISIIVGVGGIVWLANSLTHKRLDDFKEDLREVKAELKRVVETLISKGILEPFFEKPIESSSPLHITKSGQKMLEKQNVEDFLSKCDLIKKDFKDVPEIEVFRECLEWVQDPKKEGEKKVFELLYHNSELSRETAQKLLALAIRDKILKK